MAEHNDFGYWGENIAEEYLLFKGYSICQRDWHYGHKDIDIIAFDGEEIVFVEVKTRKDEKFCDAEEAVDNKKIQNLVSAAEAYVNKYEVDLPTRFDIITVVGQPDGEYSLNHIENAFLP